MHNETLQKDVRLMKTYQIMAGTAFLALASVLNVQGALMTWSASPNQSIPDNQPNSGLLSTITISASDPQLAGFGSDPYWINDVNSLTLNISGGWNGDYKIVLSHLDATTYAVLGSVTVLDRMGVSGSYPAGYGNAGFDSTVLSDTASTAIDAVGSYTAASALGAGPYAPQNGVTFGDFEGVSDSPVGIWALYVTDHAGGDVGTLQGWSLNLDVIPEPTHVALGIFGGVLAIGGLLRRRLKMA
jgi:hypothetical protein